MEEGEAGGHGWEEQGEVGVWLGGRGEAGSLLGLELQKSLQCQSWSWAGSALKAFSAPKHGFTGFLSGLVHL